MGITRYANRVPDVDVAIHAAPRPGQISLGGGYSFPRMMPDISDIAAAAARDHRTVSLQYGPLLGLPDLRREIVRFLAEDGIATTPDNILVVNGAKQGLDLALGVFAEVGDTVIVGRPTYATALHIFRNHELKTLEINVDEHGLSSEKLEQTLAELQAAGAQMPKLLYLVPDFDNPTGATLSAERRRQFVDLAERFDFMILEDDPYRRINFGVDAVPPIQSLDHAGRVIGLGTVSKIFAPGIRIGWVNADPTIIARMGAMKSDGGSSPFVQRIVADMFSSGEISRHTIALSDELRGHRDAMVAALQEHIPGAEYTPPRGGYYMWIKLPHGLDADQVTVASEEAGVTIFSGRGYFASRGPTSFVRLCFSNSEIGDIARGVEILGDVVRRLHNRPADTSKHVAVQHFD